METSDGALEAFLNSVQQEGRYFDSADFTINTLKAREKLGRYQLADSGLWLVKFVQAAVACGADSIKIGFGRAQVSVSFHNVLNWQADEVLQEVLAGTIPSDNALAHLVTGVRASAATTTETVSWACGEASVILHEDGGEVSPDDTGGQFALVATRPPRARSLKKTLSSSIAHLARQTIEEYDAVYSRCWASPIPVLLDGKQLERGYGLLSGGKVAGGASRGFMDYQNSQQAVTACLGLAPVFGTEGRPMMPYATFGQCQEPTQEVQINKPVYFGDVFLSKAPSTEACRGVLALMAGRNMESSIEFVLDGAVIKSAPFSGWCPPAYKVFGMKTGVKPPIAVRLFLPVRRQELDLSEFEVRDFDLQNTMDEALPELRELIVLIQEHMGQFWYLFFSKKYRKLAGLGLGGQMAYVAAVTKGIAVAPMAGIMGVFAGANLMIWRSSVKSMLKQMHAHIEEKLAKPGAG